MQNDLEKPQGKGVNSFFVFSFSLFFIFFSQNVKAQNISFNIPVPADVTVCEGTQTFAIEFTNISAGTLSDVMIQIDLPDGINYAPGSIQELSSSNVQEEDINDLTNISFVTDDIPTNATISFAIETSADFVAYDRQNAGAVFSNTITVEYDGFSESETTVPYNILFAALSITNVTPMAETVYVGGSYKREVQIANGGFGALSTFTLEDIHDASSTIESVSIGTLNAAGNAIVFTSDDFLTIGNGDAYFDQNESLTVVETISAAGCTDFQSTLSAFWGCDGEMTSSNEKYPYTDVVLYAPDLAITTDPTFNTCLDGSADQQGLEITNNGSGPANDVQVEIKPSSNQQYSWIDAASITLTVDGTTTSITPTSVDPATRPNCVADGAVDEFIITLPTIQPDATVTLNWDNYTCTSINCRNTKLAGWKYEVHYTDMCNSKDYEESANGLSRYRKNSSTFFEYPVSLSDGEEGTYSLMFQSATFNMPEGSDPYFEVEFDIPAGLVWKGSATDLDLSFSSGSTDWMPSGVLFNNTTRKLTAQYAFPIPNDFKLGNSAFDLTLTADCAQGSGNVNLDAQVYYVMDSDCGTTNRLPLTCKDSGVTKLYCPGNCPQGLAFQRFEMFRTIFGNSDNDLDGLPDATDDLDRTKVKTNRVMVGDVFETVFGGTVHTSATYPAWSYAYARSEMPYGEEIEVIGGVVTILDASTGKTLVCDQVGYSSIISNGKRIIDFDFSPATLLANGCSDFAGFVLEDEDQVTLRGIYKVTGNPGGIVEQILVENDFYVSDTPTGAGFQCDDWDGSITLVGYYFEVTNSENYNVTACTKTINQNFRMSVGVCCNNFGGGDIFPYEYRNWAHIKTLEVDIPEGYAFNWARIRQWRTASANKTVRETQNNITPDNIIGTIHYFDLEKYYVPNGGSLNPSDDGFHGKVFISVSPTCELEEDVDLPIDWSYKFQENTILGGNTTEAYTDDKPDQIEYFRGDLNLKTTFPTQQATGTSVTWDIVVKNENAKVENGWLYLEHDLAEMEILEILETNSGDVITPVNGLYPIGDFGINNSKTYTIKVNYNACDLSELRVISGYHCDGYPTSFDEYACSTEELMLFIEPQLTELQVKFNSALLGNNDCSDTLSVEFEMLSAKLSTVEDLLVSIIPPATQTIELVGGSVEVLYPESGSYTSIADPLLDAGNYIIRAADMDPSLETDGLPGITDVSNNRVKLRFNLSLTPDFQPGDLMNVQIGGKEPCGADLPTLSLIVDPNATFGKLTSIGLDELADDWAMAWGDYDNDGFVDLFITDNRIDFPNRLYHNEGNGTFSEVITGAIATDVATSLGATWGDYDNDGDLDLFVANNIGFKNFLYRNNGDATFTKVINDPIVNYDGYSHGVAWADYDNDGYLDLFVTDYFSTRFNHLYHNNGDGTFSDVTTALPALETSPSIGCGWADYNNDGFVDLFVTNINEDNSLYKNLGNGNFEKVTSGAIVSDGGNSVGASWGDYNNDGYLDLFVANAGNQKNFLYSNDGDGTFTKVTSGAIVNDLGHSHGSAWGDYDNDGDLDIYVGNDANTKNFFYSNKGDGTFTKLTNALTEETDNSFGIAWADFDNDMDIDLFIANRNQEANALFQNGRGKCQSKACVTLVGSNANRSAVGAKVRIKANIYGEAVWQMREVSTQTGGGVGGQNELKLLFGLGDASYIDSMLIEWPSGYTQVLTDFPMDDCQTIVENEGGEICGLAYYDVNGNCEKDEEEPGIPNLSIIVEPGNYAITTDENGAYSIFVEPGAYTISQEASTLWDRMCTLEYEAEVKEFGVSYCGNDFANQAIDPAVDLAVSISTTPHRIGFENLIAVTYCNMGTETATNVSLELEVGDGMDLLEASIPWDLTRSITAVWGDLGDLAIGESNTIFVRNLIDPATPVGTLINMTASIQSNESEVVTANNTASNAEPAVGGFDPNDISVNPEGFIEVDQELIYTIRFQNVGNAPVSTVRVVDQLPLDLDMSTFQMGIASHPYRLEITDGSALVWHFENINLPDSVNNEAQSHGYIIFKITPKDNLEEGTSLSNQASIFFDFNDPIITNTVINTIGQEPDRALADESLGTLNIAPNPTHNGATIKIFTEDENIMNVTGIIINDVMGRRIYSKEGFSQDAFEIPKGALEPGVYAIRAFGADNKEYVSKLIVH